MTTVGTLRLGATWLAFCVFTIHAAAQEALPLLKTKTEDYANVTLVSQTPTHVFIKHSRGTATIKRSNVSSNDLTQLISGVVSSNHIGTSAIASSEGGGSNVEGSESNQSSASQSAALSSSLKEMLHFDPIKVFMSFMLVFLVGGVLFYIFYSYCVKLICEKAGYTPGFGIWLPIVREVALIRASGLSGAWFLTFILPGIIVQILDPRTTQGLVAFVTTVVLALFTHLLWCVRICQARGKGWFAMLVLIFPITYPLAFLYLAFSSGGINKEIYQQTDAREIEPLPA